AQRYGGHHSPPAPRAPPPGPPPPVSQPRGPPGPAPLWTACGEFRATGGELSPNFGEFFDEKKILKLRALTPFAAARDGRRNALTTENGNHPGGTPGAGRTGQLGLQAGVRLSGIKWHGR